MPGFQRSLIRPSALAWLGNRVLLRTKQPLNIFHQIHYYQTVTANLDYRDIVQEICRRGCLKIMKIVTSDKTHISQDIFIIDIDVVPRKS